MSQSIPSKNGIAGVAMLPQLEIINPNAFEAYLQVHFGYDVEVMRGEDESLTFRIGPDTISVIPLAKGVAVDDIKHAAQLAYNWPEAITELTNHQAQYVVVLIAGKTSPMVERFIRFTQIMAAVLDMTQAIGVYLQDQQMLIPKDSYLASAAHLKDGNDLLPIDLWVYVGIRRGTQTSGFTYGLFLFEKQEIEIVNSDHTMAEVYGFLFNLIHYVVEYDVVFEDGQTVGMSARDKNHINISEGVALPGETVKVTY